MKGYTTIFLQVGVLSMKFARSEKRNQLPFMKMEQSENYYYLTLQVEFSGFINSGFLPSNSIFSASIGLIPFFWQV